MAPNNKAKNRSSLSFKLELGFANSAEFLKSITEKTKTFNKLLFDTAKNVEDAYDPELFAQLRETANTLSQERDELDKSWEEIANEKNLVQVFPNIREQILETVSYAQRIQNIGKRAYYQGLISSQDMSNLDKNVKEVEFIQQSLQKSLQEIARIDRKQFDSDVEYANKLRPLQDSVAKKTTQLAQARDTLKRESSSLVGYQKGLDEIAKKTLEKGFEGFFEGAQDAAKGFIDGVRAAFSLNPAEAEKHFRKAEGLGKALAKVSSDRKDQSNIDNSLSATQKVIESSLSKFTSVVGKISSFARWASVGISVAGGIVSVLGLVLSASDKARELNKTLLSGRSLGDLGLDLRAQADFKTVDSIFDKLKDEFTSIYATADATQNKFRLSPEQAKEELAKYAGLNLPRLQGNLQQGAGVISNLNKFVNMGLALSYTWGISTDEVAQNSMELVNEYGYGERQLQSLYGGLNRVTKGSYINVARLLGATKGLAMQSPIFGDNLKATASLFTRLYDTKILGTRDVTSYIEAVSQAFQDDDSTQRMVASLLAQKPSELVDILETTVRAMPTGTEGQQRAKGFVEQALRKLKDIQSKKLNPTAADLRDIAYALKLVPPQTKQAILAQALYDKNTLSMKASDPGFDRAMQMTMEQFTRSKLITGDENALFTIRQSLLALAKANPTKTLGDLLSMLLGDINDQAESDASAYQKLETGLANNADQLVPPLRGVTNAIEGLLIKVQGLAENIIDFIQHGLLESSFAKWIASKLGIAAPTESLSGSDFIKQLGDTLATMREQQAKILSSNGPQRAEAIQRFNEAASRLADLAQSSPSQVKASLASQSLNFTNYFTVTGQSDFPAYIKSKLDQEMKEAFKSFIVGSSQAPVATTSNIGTAVRLPSASLNVPALKQAASRRSVSSDGVTVKIPDSVLNLTNEQKELLRLLEKNPTDPKSLLLEALRIKFGSSPLFSFILREFLDKAATEKNPERLLHQVLSSIDNNRTNIQRNILSYNQRDRQSVQKALDIGFNAIRQSASSQAKPKEPTAEQRGQIRKAKDSETTKTAATQLEKEAEEMPWYARLTRGFASILPGSLGDKARRDIKREEDQEKRKVMGRASALPSITSRLPRPGLAPITGDIDYKVRNVKLKVIETTTDVASIADQAVSIRLNEISQYYNITKRG